MAEKKKLVKNFFIGLLIAVAISICGVIISLDPALNILVSSMVFLTYLGTMTVITHIHTQIAELKETNEIEGSMFKDKFEEELKGE